ncbi:hypothetical protein [Psychrobacter aquaticus]|uniref:Uncharacterized protein n=1 Tax=Psychrobacter aquaticus CMS 56 TaxID=1354303 RepID=U4T486_9GAMM|nr:hypothetical protein [Psychrobacter aquaticus]ERL55705.1 hypothetical protein M917_1442 [Psychrobacter aquaticus CMS 56]
MFKFLLANSAIDASYKADTDMAHNSFVRQSPTLLAATIMGVLFLTGCQQQSETQPATEDSQTLKQTDSEDSKPMPQSDSAAALIKQLEPIYVVQMQGLQRRLQAEYESLQAADASESEDSLLLNDAAANDTSSETMPEPNTDTEGDIEADINTSTEVGERDLTVLKRISLDPRKPIILTEDQMIDRYQQAMDALYQPVTTPLSAEDIDTLINIATLVPELFEHAEIAGRVSAKSPALARLIIQHQVWEQIQAQQVSDMQQMKLNQQKEFETLMSKFNETIEGYDEQIAKYEQTLREFQ